MAIDRLKSTYSGSMLQRCSIEGYENYAIPLNESWTWSARKGVHFRRNDRLASSPPPVVKRVTARTKRKQTKKTKTNKRCCVDATRRPLGSFPAKNSYVYICI